MKEKEDAKASPFTVNTEGSDGGTGRKVRKKNREKEMFF